MAVPGSIVTGDFVPSGMKGQVWAFRDGPWHKLDKTSLFAFLRQRNYQPHHESFKSLTDFTFSFEGLLAEEGNAFEVNDFIIDLVRDPPGYQLDHACIVMGEFLEHIQHIFFPDGISGSIIKTKSEGDWAKFTKFIAEDLPISILTRYPPDGGVRYSSKVGATNPFLIKNELTRILPDWSTAISGNSNYKLAGIVTSLAHAAYFCCVKGNPMNGKDPNLFHLEVKDTSSRQSLAFKQQRELCMQYIAMLSLSLPKNGHDIITPSNLTIPPVYKKSWHYGILFTVHYDGCVFDNELTVCQSGGNCMTLALFLLLKNHIKNKLLKLHKWTPTEVDLYCGVILLHFILTGNLDAEKEQLLQLGSGKETLKMIRKFIFDSNQPKLDTNSNLFFNNSAKLIRLADTILATLPTFTPLGFSIFPRGPSSIKQVLRHSALRFRNNSFLLPDGAADISILEDAFTSISTFLCEAEDTLASFWKMLSPTSSRNRPNHLSLQYNNTISIQELKDGRPFKYQVDGLLCSSFLYENRIVGFISFNDTPLTMDRKDKAEHILIYTENLGDTDRMCKAIQLRYGNGPITTVRLILPPQWSSINHSNYLRKQFENLCVLYTMRFALASVSLTPSNTLTVDNRRVKTLQNEMKYIGEIANYTLLAALDFYLSIFN